MFQEVTLPRGPNTPTHTSYFFNTLIPKSRQHYCNYYDTVTTTTCPLTLLRHTSAQTSKLGLYTAYIGKSDRSPISCFVVVSRGLEPIARLDFWLSLSFPPFTSLSCRFSYNAELFDTFLYLQFTYHYVYCTLRELELRGMNLDLGNKHYKLK